MAGVLGHAAQPRLPFLIAFVVGCGEPISNAPFVEESSFLDALLTTEDMAPPVALAAVVEREDTAPLLRQTLASLRTYTDFVVLPVQVSEQLREVGPQQRSELRRTWEPSALTLPVAEGPQGGQRLETMWVQADVLRTAEERFEILVEVASTEAGPYRTVGTGVVDRARANWQWDLDALVEALDIEVEAPLETLTLTLDPEGGDFGRRVEVAYGDPPIFQGFWVLDGDALFAFSGIFFVTTDERPWPGQLTVVHTEDGGGASGEIFVEEEPLGFATCWAGDGRGIWQGGNDLRIASAGDPAACPDFSGSPP